jgi:hypothetical protein
VERRLGFQLPARSSIYLLQPQLRGDCASERIGPGNAANSAICPRRRQNFAVASEDHRDANDLAADHAPV